MAATRTPANTSDELAAWIAERLVSGPALLRNDEYAEYVRYVQAQGGQPLSKRRWTLALAGAGFGPAVPTRIGDRTQRARRLPQMEENL